MSDSARLYRGCLSPDEAIAKLGALVTQIGEIETVTLADSSGRVLAADLLSAQDLPATNNAAVDGYGVDAAFLAANPSHAFPVTGRAAAGHPFSDPVPVGEAIRIFTGAVMPDGVDAVAMHEFCEFDETGNTVRIGSALKPGSNNRPAGENLRSGELIVAAGTRLTAADIGIAAAAGHGAMQVRRRLRVGLLSMGDEVVAAGVPTGHGQIHDSNRPMLATMLSDDGFEVIDLGIVPDEEEALSSCFTNALENCDALLSSGGASDGDEDHTQAAMRNNDVKPAFWGLSIKPGRPMAGGIHSGKPVMCLPGNPVAAFVCYRLAAAPILARMAGGIARPLLRPLVKCGFDHKKSAGRAEYLRVKVTTNTAGEPGMHLHGRKGAGVLSSLTGADGLVEIPVENTGVAVGDYLHFIPFRESGL